MGNTPAGYNGRIEIVRSMLVMNGFKHDLNRFSKKGEPSVSYIVDEQNGKSKVQRIKILLSEETPGRIINLGTSGQITFKGKEATFEFYNHK